MRKAQQWKCQFLQKCVVSPSPGGLEVLSTCRGSEPHMASPSQSRSCDWPPAGRYCCLLYLQVLTLTTPAEDGYLRTHRAGWSCSVQCYNGPCTSPNRPLSLFAEDTQISSTLLSGLCQSKARGFKLLWNYFWAEWMTEWTQIKLYWHCIDVISRVTTVWSPFPTVQHF